LRTLSLRICSNGSSFTLLSIKASCLLKQDASIQGKGRNSADDLGMWADAGDLGFDLGGGVSVRDVLPTFVRNNLAINLTTDLGRS
jgi:hypothetical protein